MIYLVALLAFIPLFIVIYMEHTQNDREHGMAATNDPIRIPID